MINLYEKNNGNKNYCFPQKLKKEDIIEILRDKTKKMYQN